MTDCNSVNNSCKSTTGPNFGLDRDGNVKTTDSVCGNERSSLTLPLPTDYSCKNYQLEKDTKSNALIENLVNESLHIGGSTLNVYKLLGVHEQAKLVDSTGNGRAISNGDTNSFSASNAFDAYLTEWRSIQTGSAVVASSYLGYDFGSIKLTNGTRDMYGIDTSIYKEISSISILQSSISTRRVTKARIERSDDGKKWYGVDIIVLPDDNCLNTIHFKSSVPSRYWRIRALEFNGVANNDVWGVVALQMFNNYHVTDIYNIQDKVLLENRDRDYAEDPLPIKGYYDISEVIGDLSNYGIEISSLTMYIDISFSACISIFDRPIVVGDIIEVPNEAQFSAKLERILRWMEVTDVSWSTSGYTPGWMPTLLRVVAQPAMATQETQDIFGDLSEMVPDSLGSVYGSDGNNQIYQDYEDVSKTIEANAKDMVPERGAEGSSHVRAWEQSELDSAKAQGILNLGKLGLNSTGLYVEDAMPPNNEAYTEGDVYPASPKNGDYHRLTYSGTAEDIPARLYRYSTVKGRWIYLETDLRYKYDANKPSVDSYLNDPNTKNTYETVDTRDTIVNK